MEIANIHEAKANLSALIRKALAGEEVIIARANEPLVKLTPIQQDTSPRIPGMWKGKITYPDWEEWKALDKEIEDLMVNGPLFPDEKK